MVELFNEKTELVSGEGRSDSIESATEPTESTDPLTTLMCWFPPSPGVIRLECMKRVMGDLGRTRTSRGRGGAEG